MVNKSPSIFLGTASDDALANLRPPFGFGTRAHFLVVQRRCVDMISIRSGPNTRAVDFHQDHDLRQ